MAVLRKQYQRSMYPGWLLNYLKSQDVPKEVIVESGGVDIESFWSSQETMPLDAYLKLFHWASEYLEEPHLGLKVARSTTPDDFGLFGFLTSSAETIGELYHLFERYQRILMQGAEMEFKREGDRVEIRYSLVTALRDAQIQDVEFSLASIVRLIQDACKSDWEPIKTCFSHAQYGPIEDYQEAFGDQIKFDQPSNSIWCESEIWDWKLSTANPILLTVLKDQANKLLEEIERKTDFLGYVRFRIANRLGDDQFNIEQLANELNMSSRTLHRKLRQENATFKDMKLELMMDFARDALLNEEVSIAELAQMLGYSESSAFVRVFKRMQGISPLQYRKQNIE